MSHQIVSLNVGSIHSDFAVSSKFPQRVLDGLSSVNLFVGPNNSGKSRFLRELAKPDNFSFVPVRDLSQFQQIREQIQTRVEQIFQQRGGDIDSFSLEAKRLPETTFVSTSENVFGPLQTLIHRMRNVARGHEHSLNMIKQIGDDVFPTFEKVSAEIPAKWEFERIYIPTLRGLRPFLEPGQNANHGKQIHVDHYKERTLKDYFKGTKGLSVATGLDLYSSIRSLLLGDRLDRQVVRRFEKFLSASFFEGDEVSIIPRESDDVLYVKIGQEEEHPIHQLGDGIQMIICMTFPLFRAKLPHALLFIEEPELYLHPGLQRTLINAITTEFKDAQCFIATHSNHLLDMTLDREDISIFTVRKELVETGGDQKKAKSTVERVSSGHSHILSDLGVRNSSVFLSNCTIWVEGITDRRYLRRFLHLLMRNQRDLKSGELLKLEFKEDLHFSFVEYGGSNITHWSFLDSTDDAIDVKRLCGRLMLIADKDSSTAKDERHGKLKAELGDRFIVHARREIENLLKPETIAVVIERLESKGSELNLINYDDYVDARLGEFIQTRWVKSVTRKGGYVGQYGMLKSKTAFCEHALDALNSFEDMSADALKLAEQMYKFIKDHNPR